jgi:hypothetical protein
LEIKARSRRKWWTTFGTYSFRAALSGHVRECLFHYFK